MVHIVHSVRQNGLLNIIQYNSWFKKFQSLHNAIHNGRIQANKSSKITDSFRENFFFRKSSDVQIITHNNHQMNDIHHCQILIISMGLFKKY